MVICLRIGKTNIVKTPPGDFKVTTSEIPLLSQQAVTSKGIPIPYTNLQLNPYPNIQLDLFCNDNLSLLMHNSQYVTNQFDARILVRGLLLCTNPSTWLTPHQPFDYCSWFAAASHRNTNKIWTLTPIPNWTCSVVTISPFWCMVPSTWLTNLMFGSQYAAYSFAWIQVCDYLYSNPLIVVVDLQ